MGKKVDEKQFSQIKKYIARAKTNQQASEMSGVSLETIRRVKNSKTFFEYRANNVKAHTAPKPGTIVKPKGRKSSNTVTAPVKKPTLWKRFLAFFDIV